MSSVSTDPQMYRAGSASDRRTAGPRRSGWDRRQRLDRRSGDERPGPDQRLQFELYALAVEMADRVSARRALANTFFLTVNTGLAALLGASTLRWYVAVAGIVFAFSWWSLLQSYRHLNAAKFEVITAIEEMLPLAPFTHEWRLLSSAPVALAPWPPRAWWAWLARYRQLGSVERVVPLAFGLIYVVELMRQITA
jgi:hypothetical protein